MKEILIGARRAMYAAAAGIDKVLSRQTRPVVVCYHGIGTGKSKYTVSLKDFEAQMKYLSGRRNFLVTFDDGDPSIALTFGILNRYKIKPIVFINSANVSRKLLAFAEKRGWRIGSHARTHCDLTRLSDRDLTRELKQSKTELEKATGRTVDFFAYPYGKRNSRTDAVVKQAGYKKAYGTNVYPAGDKFVVPRSVVTGDMSLSEFINSLTSTAFAIRKVIFSVLDKFV